MKKPCFLISFVLIVSACLVGGPAQARVVGRVGSVVITDKAIRARVIALLPQVSFHRRLTPALNKKLSKLALKQMIDEALLYAEARRLKLLPTKAAVEKARQAQIRRGGGKAKFAIRLKRHGMSWTSHWRQLERDLAIYGVLKKFVVAPSRVTDAMGKAYYKANIKKFRRPPEARLQQITWLVRPDAAPTAWTQAKVSAAAVVARIAKGAPFAAIAVKLAHHGKGKVKVEDHGWVHQMRLTKILDTVAFSLKKGELSKPIRTLHGYVLLRCYGRRPGQLLSFAEAKKKLKIELTKKNTKTHRAALIKRLRARQKVVISPEHSK
ncbi:MAG: peptidyl-prolyl cis-trans isomerase [Deltaproteobacteria bacterium]|nr:peptidyl-prolyl cis-trans isomerase [Deltaproteobacteria bacterium]